MSLTRIWTPSGSYSGGSTKRLIVLHTMEGFTGPNGAYDCAKYFQGNVGASSQVCIDNNRGKIWEGVARQYGSWTQCNYNSVSVSAEQSGYASWSRQYWLDNRANELHNTADWIAEEAKILGIPIVQLTSSQAQSGGRGVTYHSWLGSSGCGHSDCGDGYPVDQVIEWAKGGSTTTPAEGEDMTPGVAYWPPDSDDSKPYYVEVENQNLYYFGPDNNYTKQLIGGTVKLGSGASLAANKKGELTAAYVNANGVLCRYRRAPQGGSWYWEEV